MRILINCLFAIFLIGVGISIGQTEEIKSTPITYKVEVEITYNDLYSKDASKLIPYLIERFKDAQSFKVRVTRGDNNPGVELVIPINLSLILFPLL